jgi:hypothetical protein
MGFIQMKLPKRIKNKIENSRRNREAQANHEEWLQSQGLDNYTLKQRTKNFKGYDIPEYNAQEQPCSCVGRGRCKRNYFDEG